MYVGQQAEFFKRILSHVLGFVNNQQGASSLLKLLFQEAVQSYQHINLVFTPGIQIERVGHQAEQIICFHLCSYKAGNYCLLWFERSQQIMDQGCLACSRAARNHDKSLGALEGVVHVGHRLAVGPVLVAKSGIRT